MANQNEVINAVEHFVSANNNDAVCSPLGIILFDDVIFLCLGTQLRLNLSNQIHKLVMQGTQCYAVVVNPCMTAIILCFKTQLRLIVVNQNLQVSEVS